MVQALLQFLLECRWISSGKPPCWQLGAHEMVQAARGNWQQEVQAKPQTASPEASEDLPLAAFAAQLQVSKPKSKPSSHAGPGAPQRASAPIAQGLLHKERRKSGPPPRTLPAIVGPANSKEHGYRRHNRKWLVDIMFKGDRHAGDYYVSEEGAQAAACLLYEQLSQEHKHAGFQPAKKSLAEQERPSDTRQQDDGNFAVPPLLHCTAGWHAQQGKRMRGYTRCHQVFYVQLRLPTGEMKRSPAFRSEREAAKHVVRIYREAGGVAEDVPAQDCHNDEQYSAQGVTETAAWESAGHAWGAEGNESPGAVSWEDESEDEAGDEPEREDSEPAGHESESAHAEGQRSLPPPHQGLHPGATEALREFDRGHITSGGRVKQAEACLDTLCSQAQHARSLFEQDSEDPAAHSLLLGQLNQLLAAGKLFQVSLNGINRGLEQGLEAASVPL